MYGCRHRRQRKSFAHHLVSVCVNDARCAQGVINVNDLLAVLGDYGKRTDISKTDSNADGVINVSDLLTLLANYGATCDAGAHASLSPL